MERLPEARADDSRIYNTSVLLSPDGERVAVYRKIHLFDVELPGATLRDVHAAVSSRTTGVTVQSAFVAQPGRSSSQIARSGAGDDTRLWIVNPEADTVFVYRLGPEGRYGKPLSYLGDEAVSLHAIPGTKIDLAGAFAA